VLAKWETMFGCTDNQEVGLEAATLERVRNSSLVECPGADNSTGLKPASEAVGSSDSRVARAVGERSCRSEAMPRGAVERREVRMPA
jgi:hypothetical protein